MARLRIGLIGAGKHGSRYAHHIVTDFARDLRLVALCRRNENAGRAAAGRYQCRFTADVHDLVTAPDVDAVVIVVPPTLNGSMCEMAAAAGKAILVEKPLATNLREVTRIRTALDRNPVPLMVAHTLRFNSVVRDLTKRLDDIAPVHTIHLSQRFEPSSLAWLDEPSVSGGGIILHTGVHSFDMLRFLTRAEPRSAWCRAWRVNTRRTEDNFVTQVSMTNGVEATVAGSRSTRSRNGLIEISGARGQLVGDHAHGFAYRINGLDREPIAVEPPVPTVRETLRAFRNALRIGATPPIGFEDGRAAVALAEACYRSAEAGQVAAVA